MKRAKMNERGLTLVEVLVATAILVVAIVIALLIYDAARKSFKKGENVTEQQQAVRIAFDQLTADLRMAGFNSNPDGASNRPDEQIEAAYDTAIVFRGDYNQANDAALAGGAFNVVSTSNDEIVAYVLAKPNGSSSGILNYNADVVDVPRNGNVVPVNIGTVAMIQSTPPYTLYKVSPAAGSSTTFTRTPLVDNVYSMQFRYFDQNNAQINAIFDPTTLADDIGGAETAAKLTQRASIRRVEVSLVGMTRDPDISGWTDPSDPYAATRRHRKFQMVGDVSPRNLGLKGVRDLQADVTPPSQPGMPSLATGHCGGLWVSWAPNPSSDQVVAYRVNYGLTSSASDGSRSTGTNSLFLSGLTTGSTYYVKIVALDGSGNPSPESGAASATVTNTTTPRAVTPTPTASTALNGRIEMNWSAVTQNTSNVSGDPETPKIRDLAGYRVYRGDSASFTPAAGNLKANESVLPWMAPTSWGDAAVVNCRTYYYRITAVDTCGVESAATDAFAGSSTTSVRPQAPTNVEAFVSGPSRNTVRWQAVNRDENGNPILIETYVIQRSSMAPISTDPSSLAWSQIGMITDGSTTFVDNGAPIKLPGTTYWYRVIAADDCINYSQPSEVSEPTCAFSGSVQFVTPVDGAPVVGVVPTTVQVVGGSDTYASAVFTFVHMGTGTTTTQTVSSPTGSPPSWTTNWLASPAGPYSVSVVVTNAAGCSSSASINVVAGPDVGCCLGTNPGQAPPTTMIGCSPRSPTASACTTLSYRMFNNTCLTAVQIETMNVTWSSGLNTTARLSSVRFDGTTIWTPPGTAASPASTTFSDPKPAIPVTRNSTDPVFVYYTFTTPMSKNSGAKNEPVTTTYTFRLLDSSGQPTDVTGTCGPSGNFTFAIPDPNNGP